MRKNIPAVVSKLVPLFAMTSVSSTIDDNCSLEGSAAPPERRIKRTKDGSVFIFEPTTRTWRRETAQVLDTVDGPMPALPWAQFNVSFDGSFHLSGEPLFLADGRGLRSQDEQQHADTGRSIWDGAVALAKALEHCRWLIDGKSILELGSGRGVVSLSAARLGAKSVVATDLPYVLEDLQEGTKLNGCSVSDDGDRKSRRGYSIVEVAEFDWMNPLKFFESRVASERFDVVLGADVIWLMELVEPLVKALHAICDRSPDAEVLIVHQRRASSVEESFLAAMLDAGFVLEWTLPGHSATSQQATAGDGVAWHPDFIPDDRMSLWAFRLAKKRH